MDIQETEWQLKRLILQTGDKLLLEAFNNYTDAILSEVRHLNSQMDKIKERTQKPSKN